MISATRIRKWIKRAQSMHGGILLVIFALSALGLAMQYSASGGDITVFALPQAIRLVLGLGLMLVIAITPPQKLLASSYLIYGLFLLLLVLVEIMGVIGMGAQRWIGVGAFNIQPSEMMKLGIIVALARYFHSATLEGARHYLLLIVPIMLTLLPVGLILHQPNLGTATIVMFIAVAICFLAGIRWYYFAGAITAVASAAPIAYHFLHDYQKRRVMTFLNPDSDPLGAGYNIIQSKIAIGSGGFWGKGLLKGSQGQLDFLPEKQTDFIFTMLAEELGFIGAMSLLCLYAILITFALRLAVRCRHAYGRLIAGGVAAMLFVHIFINMAMVMGMIPVVGVPLPFLSYGGSFLLATLMACGLLMHVYINRETTLPRRRGH
jgi:rod shape determining protein RodA